MTLYKRKSFTVTILPNIEVGTLNNYEKNYSQSINQSINQLLSNQPSADLRFEGSRYVKPLISLKSVIRSPALKERSQSIRTT